MKANSIFVSVWDGGQEIRSDAFYDAVTGEVDVLHALNAPEVRVLEQEFVEFGGDEIPVCRSCHSYTLKSAMVANPHGSDLNEIQVCSDAECESNQ